MINKIQEEEEEERKKQRDVRPRVYIPLPENTIREKEDEFQRLYSRLSGRNI
jgi:hypothetical protein